MALSAWVPFAGGALGVLCSLGALRAGRRRRFIDDTPTSKARGVFIGDVELKGSAECETPLVSWLAGARCVWYSWSISERWRRVVRETYTDEKGNVRTRTRVESGSTVVASGGDAAPFHLLDDTGSVLVRPQGADVEGATVLSTTCGPSHPLYYGKGPALAVPYSTFERTFHESALPLHARIYVIGRARERRDVVAPEIAHDKRAELYLISVRDEARISGGYAWAYWSWVLFGALLALGSFFLWGNEEPLAPEHLAFGTALVALGYALVLGGGWAWMVHNSIVGLRERVRQGRANIEVQLKRRHDLIPRLAAVVQGLAAHEAEVQETLAALRAQVAIAPGVAGLGGGLAAVAPRLVALKESYPRLVAQEGYLELQRELSDSEQRIALARTYYNDIASAYNARLLVVPDRHAAALSGLRAEPLLSAEGFERSVVEVEFAT